MDCVTLHTSCSTEVASEALASFASTECAQAYRTLPFTQGRSTVFIAATNQNLKNPIVQRYLAANIFISLSWPVFFLSLSLYQSQLPPKSICGLTVLAVRWWESEWQEEWAKERERERSHLILLSLKDPMNLLDECSFHSYVDIFHTESWDGAFWKACPF